MVHTVDIKRKHPLAECEKCPLAQAKCAPTSGDPNSPIAFVSRSPGKWDTLYKKPFAGPSGKVLDYLLGHYEVKRESVILTNVVLCQTDDPPVEAIRACKPRLESEIANCSLVIAGGTEATSALTRYRAVFTARPFSHKRTSSTGVSQRVVVTNNPAIVIRDSDKFPDMVEDFRRAFDPPPPPVFPSVEIINDPDDANNAIERWLSTSFSNPIASDLEWRGREIVCAGFAARSEKAVVFGLGACNDERFLKRLREFYARRDVKFIWHNGKADTKVLALNDINARIDEDTFCMSYALDERPGYHSLEYLLSTTFAWPDYEPKSVKNFKKTGEIKDKGEERELYKYNGMDTAGTLQLFNVLNPRLDTDKGGSVRPFYERLLHAQTHFRTVELNGFNFDVEEACNINEREAIPRLYELTDRIRTTTVHPLLNPASPKQLQAVIYGEWGLKHALKDSGKKKLKTSTGREVREEIAAGRFKCNTGFNQSLVDWAELQSAFSKISKLKGAFLEGLAIRTLEDGKLYCNFNPCGTVSGRTSANDPNLQQVAREGYAEIPGIRTLFLPSVGNVILAADYSQAELRTCAKLSGDDRLLSIYRDSSRSLHKERATAFYGEGYTYEEYVKAKNINFGVTYGQGAKAFAQMYHMPEQEAQNYITSWWTEFSQLKTWVDETKVRARKDGYVVSAFGHKRRFHLITDENIGDVEREAVSSLAQNVAAWITILSVCDLVDMGVRVVATVHDSIVVDCPADQVDDTAKLMKEIMEQQSIKSLGWQRDDIPFLVDLSVGPNWGTLSELEVAA